MGLQEVHCFGGEANACHAVLAGDALEEKFREQRDVFEAFAERRDADLDDIEAVIKVLAEAAGGDFFGEVLVRRGDDAHIGDEVFV